jgi:hypothetical protein
MILLIKDRSFGLRDMVVLGSTSFASFNSRVSWKSEIAAIVGGQHSAAPTATTAAD